MASEKPPIVEKETPRNRLALRVALGAGFVAALLRIVPHPPNFSGIGGLGIFGGARLRSWQAYLLPLGIMALSDLALWLLTGLNEKYSPVHLSRVYVYASFMIYVLIGRCLINKNSFASVAAAGTIGALQFFLVTNFCEWLFQPFMAMDEIFRYSRDFDGLMKCYLMALGFLQTETAGTHPFMLFNDLRLSPIWMVLGDVLFTTAYMLVYTQLVQRAEQTEPVAVPAANA
jgi:hypothetical protein